MPCDLNWQDQKNNLQGGVFMSGYPQRGWRRFASEVAVAALGVLLLCSLANAQSTFGTVLGTVKDPSGSVIPKAKIQLINTGTNALRETETNSNGTYQFNNIDVGPYQLQVEAPGFQKTEFQPFELSSRETKHIDLDLK